MVVHYWLSKGRLDKFCSDGLDIRKAIMSWRKTKSNFQELTEIDTNSNITDNVNSGQNMPSYYPINLEKNNNILSDALKSSSYVPVPPHYNWLELQKSMTCLETEWELVFYF